MHGLKSIGVSLALAVPLVTSSCASDDSAKTDETERSKGAAKASAELGSGIDKNNMEPSIRAQNDFYAHVNGGWLKRTEIPADKSNYGAFTELADAAEKNIRTIIEDSAAGKVEEKNAKKIGDAYSAFMDEAGIDARGLEPLAPMMATINAVKTKKELAKVMGELHAHSVSIPLGMWVDQDAKNTTEYIAWFNQSGLGLPDRDYYFDEGEKFVAWRNAYKKYLADLFTLTGRDAADAEKAAAAVYAIEEKLAKGQWTRAESRDRDKTYNKFDSSKLQKLAPKMEWGALMGGLELHNKGTNEIIVRQPSYVTVMGEVFDATSIDDWKNYLQVRLLSSTASVLPKVFVDLNFGFYGKTLSGIEENRPRWKRGVSHVSGMLGEAIGEVYVSRHFKPEAKERMDKLVDNLRKAFEISINNLEWMGEETKKKAQVKLSKFTTKIGYPDKWKNYDALVIEKNDALGNLWRSRHVEHQREVNKLGKPIDRGEWFMTPQTVNAYYNPPMNEIVFPAAILQPPFFNLEADDAVNYGAIGAVIGHEFSHGFDDQGRKSDGDGNLVDWWTEDDAKEFKRRADGLVAQYNAFAPFPDATVNGELTLGENIADLSGLTVAHLAYKLSLGDKPAREIDGLTGDQRFFMGWAQAFRRKYREAELRRRLKTDPHSPSQYRANGPVSNMPSFYEAFHIQETDELFRPPAERVKIW